MTTSHIYRIASLAPWIIGTTGAAPMSTPTYRVVAYMQQYANPGLGIIEGSPGVFYSQAGAQVIFAVTIGGTITNLAIAPLNYNIGTAPVSAANSRFYSALSTDLGPNGGSAYAFSVASTPGSAHTYASQTFAPGPRQNLPDGTLLSLGYYIPIATPYLGKCDLRGNTTPIYQFASNEIVYSALYGRDGNYYGTSFLLGSGGYVFRLTPSGSLTKLWSFPNPVVAATLMQASDGNLYGDTQPQGTSIVGTIYNLDYAHNQLSEHWFRSADAARG